MEFFPYCQDFEAQTVEHWNRVLFADTLTVQKFRKQALFDDNFDPALCDVALEGNRVTGFILGTKRQFPYLERGLEPERGWINVLFVDAAYQGRGVGSRLLEQAEKKLAGRGALEITWGAYSPNYFFPGIDVETYPKAKAFFEHHGYVAGEEAFSMRADLHGFRIPGSTLAKKSEAEKSGYRFMNFDYRYALELLEFAKTEFGGGWKRNVLVSMQNGLAGDCILLAFNKAGRIAGFCMRMIDGNPMRFGPIGVGAAERNAGLGGILLDLQMFEMSRRGIYQMYFVSTDLPGRRFYERHGVSVFRTFTGYKKGITA
ncbi:MAG: GNAT family N-acetyltransferase [Treponema sp.]|jgi:GNAT superfamily N-acetyltransferase|nr:GNAT family N-acetyltransferase [Treponema sp.]